MGLKNLLLSLDIYARPPTLLINKRASLPTYPGSILSILTIALFLYLFSSSDFFQKANPQVLSQPFTFESSPTLRITKQSFPIFFRINDINNKVFNDSSIFEINVNLLRFVKNFNIEIPKFEKIDEKRVGIKRCSENDFPEFLNLPQKELNAIVQKLNLTCLENDDLEITGDYEENEVIQMLTTVSPCQNGTSDVVCKSEEEIKIFFDNPKTISLAFVNFNEDVENFENPILPNLKFSSYKIFYGEQTQSLMTLKQSIFKTNSGISDEKIIITIKPDETRDDFIILEPRPKALLYLALQVSKKYDKITRTYQNIGEALASALSLVNVFQALIKIIMAYFHHILYKLDILNKLYRFENINEKDKAKELYQNKNEDFNNGKNKFYKKDQINISIWRAFIADMKKLLRKKTNNEESLYLKTESVLTRDTNFPFILQKLHEIEKIKLLLFDKTQMFLFNFLSKPTLFLPNFKNDLDYSKNLEESIELSDEINNGFNKNLRLYETQLKENLKTIIGSNAKMDKKLLLLLDKRFMSLCEMRNETSLLEVPDEKV